MNSSAIQKSGRIVTPGQYDFRLPVSRRRIALRPATGAEDLVLLESWGGDIELAIALANALAWDVEGAPIEWGEVSVTDLDAFVLNLRRTWIGDRVRNDMRCYSPNCGERIDIDFTITQFLSRCSPPGAHFKARGWTVTPTDESSWYNLAPASGTANMQFRLPTPNDQLAVAGSADAALELSTRCLRPAGLPAQLRRRAEAAIEVMAPCLSCELQGVCPECGGIASVYFDARAYCLGELRQRAAFIYHDVDFLARRYHWSEKDIVSLPQTRRSAYVELARSFMEMQP